jgi:hypothetical protein
MKTLKPAVQKFLDVKEQHETARELFETARTSGENFSEARNAFFASGSAYEAARQELYAQAHALLNKGKLRAEYDSFDKQERFIVLCALREVGAEDLLNSQRQTPAFDELAKEWLHASRVYTAAQVLRDLRLQYALDDFNAALPDRVSRFGEAGSDAIASYEDVLGSFEEEGDFSLDAAQAVLNESRSDYDRLCDELIDAVIRLKDSGQFDWTIRELDHEVWLAVRAIIERHLPQMETLPQPEPKRHVEVLTREDEAEDAEQVA